MKFIKSISAFSLLLLVMLPVILASVFQIQKAIIRHKMEEALEKKQLVTITLNADEVHWHKKGKEIIVNGEFFDVKSVLTKNDLVVFTGLFDKQEKELHENLDKAMGKEHSGKSVLLAKLLLSPFDDKLNEISFTSNGEETSKHPNYLVLITHSELNIITPPPKTFA